jgi:septal ring factor EnvC (AmiA/AmiB activator)
MVGTMNQIDHINAAVSAKHIAELGVKLEACKFDIKDRDNHIDELNYSHAKLRKQVSNDEYTINTLRAQLKFERRVLGDLNETIYEQKAKIENMEGAIEGDNVELSVRRQDLKVLLNVVGIVQNWKATYHANRLSSHDMGEICNLLVDYTKVRPVPEIKSAEQTSGTSSIDDAGNSVTVSGPVLEAIRNLFECYENGEDWILFTQEAALNVIDQCKTIDELEQVGQQKDGVILGLQHDCRAKDKIIEDTITDARYLDNKCDDQQRTIEGVRATLRLADETHESEFNHLAKKEYSQRDKLKRISALLSDDLLHHHLTSLISLIDDIISEDLS